ncbi:MAG: RHS repeat-associated core domain-containing protein [Solirubrobacterales bacterium]
MLEGVRTFGVANPPLGDGKESSQTFTYDKAGRLIRTEDWKDAAADWTCETRDYELDADSNRTKLTTTAPGGWCGAGASTEKNSTYDPSDRITSSGYAYDAFGRITTVPQADAGGSSDLTASYFVNDLAKSITQDGLTQTITLDPLGRMGTKSKFGTQVANESYAYTDDSDAPAWVGTSTTDWTRYIEGIEGDMSAITVKTASTSTTKFVINNLRGDTVAEVSNGQLEAVREVDEFGVVDGGLPASRPYGFHGSKQREAVASGGTIAMGVRLYSPRTGRFLQVDPVRGGSDSAYDYAGQDPINNTDLDGLRKKRRKWKNKVHTHALVLKISIPGLPDPSTFQLTTKMSFQYNGVNVRNAGLLPARVNTSGRQFL